MRVGESSVAVDRETARRLRSALGEALTARREFVHTVGVHRPDGRYEVARRGADSGGNAKVFESFEELCRLYERLPRAFGAEDVSQTGADLTGSRRHLVVRHLAEHPAFDCDLTARNPLTVRKRAADGEDER